MLFTVLILLVLALVLSVLLWAATLWFQGWLYSEPSGNLYWSAPAVGVGLTLFLAAWVIVDCWTGGRVRPLHQTSVSETKRFDEIKAVLAKKGPEETFRRVGNADARLDYRLDGQADGKTLPGRPEKIVVNEGGTQVAFEPERDAKGNFKREPGQNLRYLDKYGRVMIEGELGEVSQFRFDLLFLNILFNVLHFGLWFAGLWLLLRYQWAHALGLAAGLWLTMTLFPVPMILNYAEQAFHIVTIH
jgi:hypothetical protein